MTKIYSTKSSKRQETQDKYSGVPEIKGIETNIGTPSEPKYSISLNQFAAFIVGSDAKKRKIVDNQCSPDDNYFPCYQSVGPCIRKSILSNSQDFVYSKIEELKAKRPQGAHNQRNNKNSILALESYLKTSLPLEFRTLNKDKITPKQNHLDIYGVRVKITPDLLFSSNKNGDGMIGGVKVVNKKSPEVSRLHLDIMSTLLRIYIDQNINMQGKVLDPQSCIVIDVFGKKISRSKDGYLPAKSKIKDGAREFASLWDSIQNSNDSLKM